MHGAWLRVHVILFYFLLLANFAHAGPRHPRFNVDTCVNVFARNRHWPDPPQTSVATCNFVEFLLEAIQRVQMNVTALAEDGRQAVTANHQKIKVLQEEVDELQGDNSSLFRLVYTDPRRDRRPFCEIFTYGEASEICQLLGFKNPNVHFVHLNCEKPDGDRSDCPRRFWKLRRACFKPNDAVTIPNARSSIFQCIRDPDPSETCDRLVWLSCEGYTNNFNQDDWAEIKE